jgi:flagellar basal body-associated protein FliL
MLGSLARQERRAMWGALSLVLVIAIAACLGAAAASRARRTQEAETQARLAAQTQLAPILTAKDLQAPITGARAKEIQADIQREIVATGPVASVRIYSQLGRILFDVDPTVVTVKPTYLRDIMFEVAHGAVKSEVRGGVLQTYVPVWLTPGGTVVVAEMSQPYGPIAADANRPWYRLLVVFAIALVTTVTLFALSLRGKANTTSAAQVQMHPQYRALEEAKVHAEQRARASEVGLKDLQAQYRMTLDQLKERDAELKLRDDLTAHSEDETEVVRDQLRETAERLNKAELDNNALRERLALRQSELDEYKARVLELQRRKPEVEQSEEIAGLRHRLDSAERRTVEMEEEIDRLQAELDGAADRLQLSTLSEAFEGAQDEGPTETQEPIAVEREDDDLFEHPKVIFDAPSRTTPGKVR